MTGLPGDARTIADRTIADIVEALRANDLLGRADSHEMARLAAQCRIEQLRTGALLAREGDAPDDAFLLLDGELLVFSRDAHGQELSLARVSGPGHLLGEQALVDGMHRTASLRALADSRFARIPGAAFRAHVERDPDLARRIRALGAVQVHQKVMRQLPLLRRLTDGGADPASLCERDYPDGTAICRQGEVAHEMFVILSGCVRVFRTEADGSVVQLARLQAGQSFGELGLIARTPRAATVVADGPLRLLAIAGDAFRRVFESDAQVRAHAAALHSLYRYGERGIALQFTAELFDRPALATLYRLDDGATVLAHRLIGEDVWSVQHSDAGVAPEKISFTDTARGIERTLLLADGRLVGGVAIGEWSGTGRLHGLVLARARLPDAQIASFRRTGEWLPVASPDDTVVCHCLQVRSGALAAALADGCATQQDLTRRTGAGSVCGGCVPQLAALTGESAWERVRCLAMIERGPRVRSFRFAIPESHRGTVARPGQRIVLRAPIDGVPVTRPYTLTSPATGAAHYEITVQREPRGVMSGWLFDTVAQDTTVEILPPSGTSFFDLAQARPLVCLVGGIGVTPALAILRSAAAIHSARRIHVDYSVSERADIVCNGELALLASGERSVHIRVTRESGRFQAHDIAALAQSFPEADWLICGSRPFQAEAQRLLVASGVPPAHLHIESFAAPAAEGTAVLSPRRRRLVGYGLLAGIAGFVIQARLGIEWPLLTWLQTKLSYSALTGAGLVVLLLLQWRLGYTRMRGRVGETPFAYGLHIALGPLLLLGIFLHSARLGYILTFALCLSYLASLAAGAVIGAHPRSPRWDGARRALLAGHITLSCLGSVLAVTHGFMALWY